MRRLVLLALVVLATFPLSAHGRWRGPRRVIVVEDDCRIPYSPRWEDDRWERRDHGWHRRYDCDDDRVVLRARPLVPPFQGRVELWIR